MNGQIVWCSVLRLVWSRRRRATGVATPPTWTLASIPNPKSFSSSSSSSSSSSPFSSPSLPTQTLQNRPPFPLKLAKTCLKHASLPCLTPQAPRPHRRRPRAHGVLLLQRLSLVRRGAHIVQLSTYFDEKESFFNETKSTHLEQKVPIQISK